MYAPVSRFTSYASPVARCGGCPSYMGTAPATGDATVRAASAARTDFGMLLRTFITTPPWW
jgi:hypothetical protein